jgi:asparagine synthetase B (glutamine-hydrolysing)
MKKLLRNDTYLPKYYNSELNEVDISTTDFTAYGLDPLGVLQTLLQCAVIPPVTPYSDITSLAPFDGFNPGNQQYFYTKYPSINDNKGYDYSITDFEEKFKNYFKNIPHNKPVSILFSGGKDSGVIAYLVKKLRPDLKIKLYFLDNEAEKPRAEFIAQELGYELVNISLTQEVFFEAIENSRFFCTDLTYPEYYELIKQARQWSDIILDGSGNDMYIGYVPAKNDFYRFFLKKFLPKKLKRFCADIDPRFKFLSKEQFTLNLFNHLPDINDVKVDPLLKEKYVSHAQHQEAQFKDFSFYDLRVNTRGRYLDNFQIYPKVLACTDGKIDIRLPFTDFDLASYIHGIKMNQKWGAGKNKIIFREYMSKSRLYDSLPGGKKGMPSSYLVYYNEVKLRLFKINSSFVIENKKLIDKYPAFAYLLLYYYSYTKQNSIVDILEL